MITIPTLRTYIDLSAENFVRAEAILSGVQNEFEVLTNRWFKKRSNVSEYFRIPREDLRKKYLFSRAYGTDQGATTAVTSITEYKTRVESDGTILVQGEDIDFDPTTGVLENLRVDGLGDITTPWGPLLKIQFSSVGFNDDQAPPDILIAIAKEVEFRLKRNDASKVAVLKELLRDAGSVEYVDPMQYCPEFRRAVTKYKSRSKNY